MYKDMSYGVERPSARWRNKKAYLGLIGTVDKNGFVSFPESPNGPRFDPKTGQRAESEFTILTSNEIPNKVKENLGHVIEEIKLQIGD